jgi:hypothetical protein
LKTISCSYCTSLIRMPILKNIINMRAQGCMTIMGYTPYNFSMSRYRDWIKKIEIYCTLLNPKSLTMKLLKKDIIRRLISGNYL